MNTQLEVINPTEYGLDEKQAKQIEQDFAPLITEREALAGIYQTLITSEITPELVFKAGDLRKKLVKVRTGNDKVHKANKAFFLAAGRFVDALKNKNNVVIEEMESKLSEIENYYIVQEQKRMAELKAARLAVLSEITETPEVYNSELMNEQAFDDLVAGIKLRKAQREAEEKAFREAEEARIKAEKEERERVEKENARLKAEAEAINKKIEAERKAYEAHLAKQKAEAEAKQAEIEAKAKAEREAIERASRIQHQKAEVERLRLAAELKKKEDAEKAAKAIEEKAEQDRILAERKAAKAPDKEKMKIWVDSFSIPDLKGIKDQELCNVCLDIEMKFEAFKTWAINQINNK